MSDKSEVDLDFGGFLFMDDRFDGITICKGDAYVRLHKEKVKLLRDVLTRWLESDED